MSHPDLIDLKENNTYEVIMNWGIFKDENDTSTKYMYGAKTMKDVQTWILDKPDGAKSILSNFLGVFVLIVLYHQ